MDNTKKCTACLAELTVYDFHKDKSRKGGLALRCKVCVRLSASAWRLKNPDRAKEAVNAWHKKHPDRVRELIAAWEEKHPGRSSELKKVWYERSRDNLEDAYVALALRIPVADCPPDLLEMKREYMSMRRLTKKLNEELNEVTKGESK